MNREELIKFIVWAINEVEGVEVSPDLFEGHSDEKLEEEADFLDYVLGK